MSAAVVAGTPLAVGGSAPLAGEAVMPLAVSGLALLAGETILPVREAEADG